MPEYYRINLNSQIYWQINDCIFYFIANGTQISLIEFNLKTKEETEEPVFEENWNNSI